MTNLGYVYGAILWCVLLITLLIILEINPHLGKKETRLFAKFTGYGFLFLLLSKLILIFYA